MKGKIIIALMVVFEVFVFLILLFYGYSYYTTAIEQRFFHSNNELLRSSGLIGHGLGILGSLLIVVGIFSYMARKRLKMFYRWGLMKNWLQFHIFLCSLGAILILFHTTFKFGGIISAGFWSMMVVVVSGIVGRFIYIQIPRTIEGRELSVQELRQMQIAIGEDLLAKYEIDDAIFEEVKKYQQSKVDDKLFHWIVNYFNDLSFLRMLKREVRLQSLSGGDAKKVIKLFREEIVLTHRIKRLSIMNRLFRNWHVLHLPFALVMLVIMIIHVVVVILFGFKWIF